MILYLKLFLRYEPFDELKCVFRKQGIVSIVWCTILADAMLSYKARIHKGRLPFFYSTGCGHPVKILLSLSIEGCDLLAKWFERSWLQDSIPDRDFVFMAGHGTGIWQE